MLIAGTFRGIGISFAGERLTMRKRKELFSKILHQRSIDISLCYLSSAFAFPSQLFSHFLLFIIMLYFRWINKLQYVMLSFK